MTSPQTLLFPDPTPDTQGHQLCYGSPADSGVQGSLRCLAVESKVPSKQAAKATKGPELFRLGPKAQEACTVNAPFYGLTALILLTVSTEAPEPRLLSCCR